MRRSLLIIGMLLCVAFPCHAQNQVLVTATVTSPDGKIYSGATGAAVLVTPGNAQPMYGSQTVSRNPQPISGVNGFGTFSIQLWNTTLLSPTPVLYRFNITDASGHCSFQTGTIAIIGPVDLSTFISSYAAPLAPCQGGGGGGGGSPPGGSNGQVQYNSSGTYGGAPGVKTNGTSLTITNNLNVGGNINDSTLSTNRCVQTDGSKNLTSAGSGCGGPPYPGPNPWRDVSAFEGVPGTTCFSPETVTGSISSGSHTLTVTGGTWTNLCSVGLANAGPA